MQRLYLRLSTTTDMSVGSMLHACTRKSMQTVVSARRWQQRGDTMAQAKVLLRAWTMTDRQQSQTGRLTPSPLLLSTCGHRASNRGCPQRNGPRQVSAAIYKPKYVTVNARLSSTQYHFLSLRWASGTTARRFPTTHQCAALLNTTHANMLA